MEGDSRSIRIAVVEDQEATLRLVERTLSRRYTVSSFLDSQEALESIRRDPPDLVVSDVDMPGLNGLEIVRAIRQDGSGPYIPILLMSANVDNVSVVEGLDVGADDYLPKPVSTSKLMAKVRSALRMRAIYQRLDAQNRRLQETLGELHRTQVQLLQAQRLEAIGQLAAGIAHEINTPTQFVSDNLFFLADVFQDLSRIMIDIGSLQKEAAGLSVEELRERLLSIGESADAALLEDEAPRAFEDARHGLERISKIVLAMKEFSHPGTGQKVDADLNSAIESTLTVARNEWKYVAEVELDLDESLPPVPALPNELNQVFLNLIVNAAHAIADQNRILSRDKGIIRIRTRGDEQGVTVEIEDDGTGIPEEIKKRIFDPFFTTKEVGKGTGQGLAIARSVMVDKHGGTIDCENAPSGGSRFRLRLPRHTREGTR